MKLAFDSAPTCGEPPAYHIRGSVARGRRQARRKETIVKTLAAFFAFLTFALSLLAALPAYLEKADELTLVDRNAESFALLTAELPTAATDQERAEIYWRLSIDTLLDTDNLCAAGTASSDSLRVLYKEGESYADQAISLDPDNPMGYYVKACNLGRWAQSSPHPLLTSLSKADSMRSLLIKAAQVDSEVAGPWAVLAQLYEKVPGWPFSFGNTTWAVSLGRKALMGTTTELANRAQREIPLDYSTELASHLAKRGWSSEKRAQEQVGQARMYNSTSDPVEKYFYFEGIVEIPPLSDREEAVQLCRFVLAQLQEAPSLTQRQTSDLKNAREVLAALGERVTVR
jgi:hypothetical protein